MAHKGIVFGSAFIERLLVVVSWGWRLCWWCWSRVVCPAIRCLRAGANDKTVNVNCISYMLSVLECVRVYLRMFSNTYKSSCHTVWQFESIRLRGTHTLKSVSICVQCTTRVDCRITRSRCLWLSLFVGAFVLVPIYRLPYTILFHIWQHQTLL